MDARLLVELKTSLLPMVKIRSVLREGWSTVISLIEEGMREGSIRKIQIPFLLKYTWGTESHI